jgi:hypothetical protein
MSVQFFRLWPRRPHDGSLPLGLSLDDEGLLLAGNCRLIQACLDRDGHLFYRARPVSELSALLTAAYDEPIDATSIYPAVEQIAKFMTERNWTRARLAALHLRLPELADAAAAARVLKVDALLKVTAAFDPDKHPRWPKGSQEGHGGQFRPNDRSGAPLLPAGGLSSAIGAFGRAIARILPRLLRRPPKAPDPSVMPPAPKPAPPRDEPPGIGHNRPPEPIDEEPAPPQVPQLPPMASGRDIYRWGRRAAEAIGEAARQGYQDIVRAIADAVDAARDWLHTQHDNIIASLDPPKSYEELMRDAEEKGGGSGYEVHHIVEQWRKKSGEFSEDEIEDPSNKVRIPYYQHKMIQSFYQTPNEQYGGLTPREYLSNKSFDEQLEFGKDVLRKFGVMK